MQEVGVAGAARLFLKGEHAPMIDNFSPPEAKIRLFGSLFGGRPDVYARRYESATSGRTGYSPVCSILSSNITEAIIELF